MNSNLQIIHGILTLYNNYIMASCSLAKIQPIVKGHHVYNYTFNVFERLNCSIGNDNEYSENAIAVSSSSKKTVGHIPEPPAKLFLH